MRLPTNLACSAVLSLVVGPTVAADPLIAGSKPTLLAPGLISSSAGEYSPTWDSARRQLLFMRRTLGEFDYTLYESSYEGGDWSKPEILPFSGDYRDGGPYLAPDGESLVFDSRRPASGLAEESINLWRVERSGDRWSQPVLIAGASGNAPDEPAVGADEFGPVLDAVGQLYFYSFRQPMRGGEHYVAGPPAYDVVRAALDIPDPSSSTFVSYFTFSANMTTLVMEGRSLSGGDSDLFYACKGPEGWGSAVPLDTLNTSSGEGAPYLSADGALLFFASDRSSDYPGAANSNLYAVSTGSLPVPCSD